MPYIETALLDDHELAGLGELAAHAIQQALMDGHTPLPQPASKRCTALGAAFVTLTQAGRLRGCIGSLVAHRALRDDVAANARAAALHDPRFQALTRAELAQTEVAISVLSAPSALLFKDEDDFYTQLRPGIDGLIIEHQGRRATFLPSVWEQLPTAVSFIQELRRKAGIEPRVALTALQMQRYTTQHSRPRGLLSA